MKKRLTVVLCIFMCLVLFAGLLTACVTEDSPQKYTISFYSGETLVGTVATAGNEKIVLPAAPAKAGYTFGGWYTDKDVWKDRLTEDSFAGRALTENLDVYARYIRNEESSAAEYTISFYIDGALADIIRTSGNETLDLPAAPEKDGYTFAGWFFDNGTWRNELTADTYSEKPLTGDVSVYAFYEKTEEPVLPQEYTVFFDVDNGTPVAAVTTSRIEKQPQTTREGYTFEGWYTDKNFTEKVTFPYDVTRAQTLYAKWKKNTYTVHFETDGGTAVGDMIVSVIERAPSTEKKGYTFDGWYADENFTEKVTFPYDVTRAQTLYAKWTQNISAGITFTVDADGVLTGAEGLTESGMTVEIPSVVNGIAVREIGQDVFKDNKNIAVLIIPDTVERLGYRVCSGCTALREVRLSSSSLRVISDEAFDGCSSLQKVNFPSTLKEIRSDAFSGTALTEFTAPDSLTDIWGYAFKDCTALKSVELNNVRNLGSGAFMNCTALESVSLSDNMEKLNDHIFDGCASLARIDMPDKPIAVSFTVLGGTAYYNNPSNWENGVLYADGYLIAVNADFAALTEYAVKEGTKVIADNAFSGAGYSGKVKKITLPDGLYRIGQGAFAKLSNLTEINVPESVRSIGYGAFAAPGYVAFPLKSAESDSAFAAVVAEVYRHKEFRPSQNCGTAIACRVADARRRRVRKLFVAENGQSRRLRGAGEHRGAGVYERGDNGDSHSRGSCFRGRTRVQPKYRGSDDTLRSAGKAGGLGRKLVVFLQAGRYDSGGVEQSVKTAFRGSGRCKPPLSHILHIYRSIVH